ncbi:AGAP010804-PA, partial [Anopheles gambiae str. PEST]
MNVSSYSVIQTSVRNIQIDARNAITVFSVSDSKLVMIPESISNLRASVNIAVERCLVDALDMAKFCDLSQLQVLNFAANRIRFIINSSTKRCSVYDSLQILALPNNLLTTLNMEIFNHFGKIQMLEVKQNRIKAVLGRFESTASLQLLLSKNKLTSIDFCGWNVSNMTSLEMDYNELTTVPACLDNVNSLTLLSIRTNRIQNVAIDSFAKLKRLVTLDVSFNNLTTIMLNSPHYPTSLRDLWITGNNLSQLDLSLVSVPSLELDVRMNCISSMDVDSISPNITKLNMAANPIDCSWKTIFNHFGKIQMLEVKQNRIKAVLGRFESTASLQLLLSKNKLTSIDFCGWNVSNMTSLEMDYNELTTVPACLDNVNSLTLLSIRTNRIQNVAIDSFAKLKRLVTLDVSFNNLTTIMLNSPHYPTSLRDLWITGNNLSQLDLSLVSVPSLELDVRMN